MARRRRNYQAEEARRNAEARRMGFTSRAQMRTALKQGWTPERGKGGRIVSPPKGERFRPVAQGIKGIRRIREENARWSRVHSHKPTSKYRPSMTDEQARAYHAAYVDLETRAHKIENDLVSLRYYLVDTMHYYSDESFDERYNSLAALFAG